MKQSKKYKQILMQIGYALQHISQNVSRFSYRYKIVATLKHLLEQYVYQKIAKKIAMRYNDV